MDALLGEKKGARFVHFAAKQFYFAQAKPTQITIIINEHNEGR